jgi:hypothetical protein
MDEQEQQRLELQHALEETVTSEGWKLVIAPVLRQRKAELERRLAGTASTMDEVRVCQGAWKILEEMAADPLTFFGVRRL